jgi:hypothetical protein
MPDYSTRSQVYAAYGNEFDAPGNFIKTGSGAVVRTTSGGTVRSSKNSNTNKNAESILDSIRKKSSSSSRRRKPQVLEGRNLSGRGAGIGINGDNIITVKEFYSSDSDTQENSTKAYLRRLQNRRSQNKISSNRTNSAISFSQQNPPQLSSGVRRIDNPLLQGTGFGSSGAGGTGGSKGSVASASSTIGLPTPDNLQENMNISYESKHKGAGAGITDAMMNALNTSIRSLAGDKNANMQGAMQAFRQNVQNAANFYSDPSNLAALVGAVGNMYGVGGFNTAFNNSMVQQFSGVMPRTFNFRWKLYADSETGGDTIFKIIQVLKEAAHPELIDPYMNIVRYPSLITRFDIRSPNGLIIFPIFESVITDITVDYTASGSPTFFKSGAPTSVALSISLTEVTSRLRQDYASNKSGFA